MIYCLYSVLDIYEKLKELDQEIHRGRVVYIPC